MWSCIIFQQAWKETRSTAQRSSGADPGFLRVGGPTFFFLLPKIWKSRRPKSHSVGEGGGGGREHNFFFGRQIFFLQGGGGAQPPKKVKITWIYMIFFSRGGGGAGPPGPPWIRHWRSFILFSEMPWESPTPWKSSVLTELQWEWCHVPQQATENTRSANATSKQKNNSGPIHVKCLHFRDQVGIPVETSRQLVPVKTSKSTGTSCNQ